MNWKTLCLIAGLTLTANLAACSSKERSTNQVTPSVSPATDTNKPSDAMQEGGAMKQGDAMKQEGDAMKQDTTTKP
jgi:hypothetical protein